ncbi:MULTISPECIES: hypothetical protein [unclassified Nocardioides]|uniref:hypothetical protein n=1 Tax=unclassified Nocardioides TaxID=2615069 RepID=UPI0030151B11
MSLWSRRSATHRADLDDPTWEPPVLPPRAPWHRDRVGLALALIALVCLVIGLADSVNDWDRPWSLALPVGLVASLIARLRSWWFERRTAAASGEHATVS